MAEDRRREPRTPNAHPVYVRPADASGNEFEEVCTMKDFSREGLYFLTEQSRYITGMQLRVIPALGSVNLEYVGEVVRVERSTGGYGVALRLLRAAEDLGAPLTAARFAFESFALAAAPIPSTPR
jgi:hypothetical protein